MVKLCFNIEARQYDNCINVYVDGNIQRIKMIDNKFIECDLEEGEHYIKIERNTNVSGKNWFWKNFFLYLIGIVGSIPPDLEKGKIFNSVFEGTIVLHTDTVISISLTDDEQKPYKYNNEELVEIKNITFEDLTLTKRRSIIKAIIIGIPLVLLTIITVLIIISKIKK